jgi:hypothetical protein
LAMGNKKREIRQMTHWGNMEFKFRKELLWDSSYLFHSEYLHHPGAFKIKRLQFVHLADVLRLRDFASHGSQVAAQGAAEELEQHLKADAGESWVVAAPREFFWLVFLFFSSQLWPRVSPSF